MRRALATLTALASLAALSLTTPPPASAQPAKAGVVTALLGTATVVRASTKESLPLKFRDAVFLQDRVTTGDNSVARILLGGKAVVTVRERSVLTISEAPGVSTIDVSIGGAALAVLKDRMKPGESIQIKTPNAVAAIRGTVVITQVDQTTAQAGPIRGAAFTTTFTVVRGVVEVMQWDPGQRRTFGAVLTLGASQRTFITGATAPRPAQTLPPDVLRGLSDDYKLKVKEAPAEVNAQVASTQMGEALGHLGNLQGAKPAVGAPSSAADSSIKGSETPAATGSSGPGTPGGTTGSAPTAAAPSVSTPAVSAPTVSTPTVSTPTISTPTVSTPTASTPKVSTPTVSVPSFSMPTVSMPSVPVSTGIQSGSGASASKAPKSLFQAIQELQKQKKFRKKND